MACPRCARPAVRLLVGDLTRPGKSALTRLAGLPVLDPIGLMVCYRLAHAAYHSAARPLAWILTAVMDVIYGCDIHPAACLGERAHFAHTRGVVIGPGVVIDADVVIHGNVTLGVDDAGAFPSLGGSVTVYAGAVVIGGIRVGDGARIGANAVAHQDVPPGALCVGVPGRIVDRVA